MSSPRHEGCASVPQCHVEDPTLSISPCSHHPCHSIFGALQEAEAIEAVGALGVPPGLLLRDPLCHLLLLLLGLHGRLEGAPVRRSIGAVLVAAEERVRRGQEVRLPGGEGKWV